MHKKEMERKKYWCCPSDPSAGVFPVTNVKKTHTHTKQTTTTLSNPGLSPNGYHLPRPNNYFRGLAFRLSVSDKNTHRTPNQQMKIGIFGSDEVTVSDLTRNKNI